MESGVPQGSVLVPLLFLIFINDLEDNIKSQIKFFADDMSLFSIVCDHVIPATGVHNELKFISNWETHWKMSFNPDPSEQAAQFFFSHKIVHQYHPNIYFNNVQSGRVEEHKHLGHILDSKINVFSHIIVRGLGGVHVVM